MSNFKTTKPPRNQSSDKQNFTLAVFAYVFYGARSSEADRTSKVWFWEQRDVVLSHSFMAKSGTDKIVFFFFLSFS